MASARQVNPALPAGLTRLTWNGWIAPFATSARWSATTTGIASDHAEDMNSLSMDWTVTTVSLESLAIELFQRPDGTDPSGKPPA